MEKNVAHLALYYCFIFIGIKKQKVGFLLLQLYE